MSRAGKTFLMAALTEELERRGERVVICTPKGWRYSDVPEGKIIPGKVVRLEIEGASDDPVPDV